MICQHYQQLSSGVLVIPSYLNQALASLCPVPLTSHLLLPLVLSTLLQDLTRQRALEWVQAGVAAVLYSCALQIELMIQIFALEEELDKKSLEELLLNHHRFYVDCLLSHFPM